MNAAGTALIDAPTQAELAIAKYTRKFTPYPAVLVPHINGGLLSDIKIAVMTKLETKYKDVSNLVSYINCKDYKNMGGLVLSAPDGTIPGESWEITFDYAPTGMTHTITFEDTEIVEKGAALGKEMSAGEVRCKGTTGMSVAEVKDVITGKFAEQGFKITTYNNNDLDKDVIYIEFKMVAPATCEMHHLANIEMPDNSNFEFSPFPTYRQKFKLHKKCLRKIWAEWDNDYDHHEGPSKLWCTCVQGAQGGGKRKMSAYDKLKGKKTRK